MKNILFPTDFSTTTNPALGWARLFAGHYPGASLTLLHVFEPPTPDGSFLTFGDMGAGVEASAELEHLSRERVEMLATELRAEGLTVSTDWRMGDTEDTIREVARTTGADLIIAGRTDVATFFERLAGSAANDIAADAPCPVLVIPVPDETAVGGSVQPRPAQLKNVVYVMQQDATRADVNKQTADLTDTFGSMLQFVTVDKLDGVIADLLIVADYGRGGLFAANPVRQVLAQNKIPVLVYHDKPE